MLERRGASRKPGLMIGFADPERKSRPKSIWQAAAFGIAPGRRDAYLREFRNEFYIEVDPDRRAAMLADEPPSTEFPRADAYYAAVAEHLAFTYRLPVPPWTSSPSRIVDRPFFPLRPGIAEGGPDPRKPDRLSPAHDLLRRGAAVSSKEGRASLRRANVVCLATATCQTSLSEWISSPTTKR